MSIEASLPAGPVVDAAAAPTAVGSAADGAAFAELVAGLLEGPVAAPPGPLAAHDPEVAAEDEPAVPEVPVDAALALAVLVPVALPPAAPQEAGAPTAVVPAGAPVAPTAPEQAPAPVVPGPAVPDVPAAQPADLPAVVTTATDAPQPTEAPVVGPVAPTGSTTSGPDADAQDAPPSPRPLETLAAPITAPVTTTNQTGPTAPVAPAAPTAPTVTPEVRAATQHVVDEVVRLTEASASAPRQLVLRLDPGSLGEVHVRLRVHAGVVRVHLSAGDAAVREALASDVGRLHTLLGTRLDDVRVVVQDLPRVVPTALPTTPTAPERAGQPLTGGHHEPSGGHGSGHQPGHAPEHGRPTRTSDVTPATDGTHRWVPRPATADPLAAGPHRLDVSV